MKQFFDTRLQFYLILVISLLLIIAPHIPITGKVGGIAALFGYKFVLLDIRVQGEILFSWMRIIFFYLIRNRVYVKTTD